MSDGSKNFTLRLSADDQARLERLATGMGIDRTGALRRLIRRAAPTALSDNSAAFVPVTRGAAGRVFSIRLRRGGQHGS